MLGFFLLLLFAAAVLTLILTVVLARGARTPPRRTDAYAIAREIPCDPGEIGLQFESWMLDLPDGDQLPVWEINLSHRADRSRGEQLTAVFVHGWASSRIDMLARLEDFAATGRFDRAVLYDLRGHGEASGGGSRLGADEHRDLLALLERLGDRNRIVLIGFSMGAVIALHAASTSTKSPATQEDRNETGDHVASRICGVLAHGVYGDFHDTLRNRLRLRNYPARPFTDLVMLWFRVRGLRHQPLVDIAREVTVPVALLHGATDDISSPSDAEAIAEAAPDATFEVFEDVIHTDFHIRGGEAYRAAIMRFLDRV